MPEQACVTIRKLVRDGIKIKFVRLDNAGENVVFAKKANGK